MNIRLETINICPICPDSLTMNHKIGKSVGPINTNNIFRNFETICDFSGLVPTYRIPNTSRKCINWLKSYVFVGHTLYMPHCPQKWPLTINRGSINWQPLTGIEYNVRCAVYVLRMYASPFHFCQNFSDSHIGRWCNFHYLNETVCEVTTNCVQLKTKKTWILLEFLNYLFA